MADPVTAISLASAGFSVLGSATKASADSRAAGAAAAGDQYKATQADNAAKYGQVQATQTDQYYRQQLQSTLANISAVGAAQGASDSPTNDAIAARVQGQSDTERTAKLANIQQQVTSDQGAAGFYRQSAQNALNAGGSSVLGDVLGGAGSFAGGLGGAFKSMNVNGNGFQGWMSSSFGS